MCSSIEKRFKNRLNLRGLRVVEITCKRDQDSAMASESIPVYNTFIMASVASQIVFHPTVSQCLKFGGTTLGRDKVSNL